MPFKKGESGNPSGKPKGCKNKATRAKEDYFWVFAKLGGKQDLLSELKVSKRAKLDFFLRVLPSLMPKNGDHEDPKKLLVEYGLTPEMESLMRAMIEARRRIDRPSDKRADDIVECQS